MRLFQKPKLFFISFLLLSSLFAFALPVFAAQNPTAISQGFTSGSSGIVAGALVSSSASNSQTAQLANTSSTDRLIGIANSSALVALSDGERQVQVVISGTTKALVSDINGSIRAGDKITASPIDGVGMLATNDTQIVGTATAGLTAKTAKTQNVVDKDGKDHTVHIGEVPVQVSISFYLSPTSKFLPPFIQSLADTVAGRPVSLIRIMLATVLLLLAFGSIFVLVYGSVRSGLTSIGRNPLAAAAIRRGLVGVGVAALLILAFTLIATYLVLSI
ncbi:MAG TPA: hypothetical protein VMY99_01410 [Nevskiaceae bacterium]|nr:hypothetical protein [Nevskiaceae bacterium]